MDGWTFPRDLTKVPSDAVTLRARIASGLLVHGVALTSSVPERVAARPTSRARRILQRVRRTDDDRFIIEISGKQGTSEIHVTRSGTELSIESVGPVRRSRS